SELIQKECAQVPFGRCFCGRAILTPEIRFVDCSEMSHEVHDPNWQPHAHYFVPILYGDKKLGLINLYLKEGHRCNQKEEDFLATIANTLASIIVRRRIEEDLQQSENRLRLLSSQLLTVQETERKRMARELHDGIGQMLTAIKFKLESTLQRNGEVLTGEKETALKETIPMIQESIDEVRKIQMDLRPSTLDDLGILATITWFCREFQKIYSGIGLDTKIYIQENEIPTALKTVIYRVMQEAINNLAKHSRANQVILTLGKNGLHIELSIQDNGVGFNPEAILSPLGPKRGFGLTSMSERTELSGGSFSIRSEIGGGTEIKAKWPIG
ncbi:MAG: GAF domain-containing sensor histidine kinase, partial [Candidatus Tectomicrobia bacterium]|nr:GAF domain-containing sensor histidine kinase [Candidatus Tectomicrobia bacterium]